MIVNGWDFGPRWLMRTSEVADVFQVNVRTVVRWAELGKLSCIRTPGGERRYSRQQVEHVNNGGTRGNRMNRDRKSVV
mgnify:CR=1 FL=1